VEVSLNPIQEYPVKLSLHIREFLEHPSPSFLLLSLKIVAAPRARALPIALALLLYVLCLQTIPHPASFLLYVFVYLKECLACVILPANISLDVVFYYADQVSVPSLVDHLVLVDKKSKRFVIDATRDESSF